MNIIFCARKAFFKVVAITTLTSLALFQPTATAAPYIMAAGGCYDVGAHAYVSSSFCSTTTTTATTTTTTTSTTATTTTSSTTTTTRYTYTYTPPPSPPPPKQRYSATAIAMLIGGFFLKDNQLFITGLNSTESTDQESCSQPEEGGVSKQRTSTQSYQSDFCANGGSYSRDDRRMAKPAARSMASNNLYVGLRYSNTHIDASHSVLGSTQKMRTTAITFANAKDFGDWGYVVSLPIRHTTNNSAYSDLNSTQIGLSFAPTYHLLKEQVHGINLDLGVRAGYNRIRFSDVAAIRSPSGPYAISGFSNANTFLLGINARTEKQVSTSTRVQFGVEAAELRTHGAEAMLGRNASVFLASASAVHQYSEKLMLSATLQATRMTISALDARTNFGTAGIGMRYLYNNRTSLVLDLNRTFSGFHFATTTGMLYLDWQLN